VLKSKLSVVRMVNGDTFIINDYDLERFGRFLMSDQALFKLEVEKEEVTLFKQAISSIRNSTREVPSQSVEDLMNIVMPEEGITRRVLNITKNGVRSFSIFGQVIDGITKEQSELLSLFKRDLMKTIDPDNPASITKVEEIMSCIAPSIRNEYHSNDIIACAQFYQVYYNIKDSK
jgi:hypothetical protein